MVVVVVVAVACLLNILRPCLSSGEEIDLTTEEEEEEGGPWKRRLPPLPESVQS